MNKQSNTYTITYIVVLSVLVGTALALVSLSLSSRQQENKDADKMRQILASVGITPEKGDEIKTFDEYIVSQEIIDCSGNQIGTDAFNVDVAAQSKLPDSARKLPIFTCKLKDMSTKYIIPVYGAGLWGPIWGYVSFDSDGSTIYGAYFAHQGETPGLGAEIAKPAFSDQFIGKTVFKDGAFKPVTVVKAGQKPLNGEDYVDGISGGTITSKGVASMLSNCLEPYKTFLQNLSTK